MLGLFLYLSSDILPQNHILDFSKINHLEQNWRRSKRGGTRPRPRSVSGALSLRQSDMPMINLFADIDISVVCEEVVEGVFAGHVFQNVTAQSFDMVPDARGKMSDPKKHASSSNAIAGSERWQDTEVAVILDVDIQNYYFTTQPGAFRRIVMNLLGNALKYTSHGYVKITLEAAEIEDLHTPGSSETIPRSLVVLTVTDTGKGISSEFLRSKLFTPFAQENSLSSGTGLGLSIVRSIVALLEGDISIDSEIGRGTRKLTDHFLFSQSLLGFMNPNGI
jgi:signal transduction histidine kinase